MEGVLMELFVLGAHPSVIRAQQACWNILIDFNFQLKATGRLFHRRLYHVHLLSNKFFTVKIFEIYSIPASA